MTTLASCEGAVGAPAADVDTRLAGFVAGVAYQRADPAYPRSDTAYQYAGNAYFRADVTEFVAAVPDIDADDANGACVGPEIVREVQRVFSDASNQRADAADVLPYRAIVVSDGQELSADCINVLSDAADEHSRCINP